uniref:RING-type E3 ubiquitin transferase n=1 Tax=Anthurium amnicola TaxID=1678845 RepID=A0A1D1YCJ5_9ARAE
MGSLEESVMADLLELQKQLGKKHSFEGAVSGIASVLRGRYASSSPALRKSIYSAVCRVATILRTRYTAPGFWLAGLRLFQEAERLATDSSEKEHLKSCIVRAHEQLHEFEHPQEVAEQNNRHSYLFEGHLTVEPEPPPPAWLVAQNVLTTLAASQDWNAVAESSRGQGVNNNSTNEGSRVPEFVQQLINNVPEFNFQELESVIEASLQEIGAGPQKPPPASKEVVANLPVIHVTNEVIARLGSDTECAVCRENLVVNDKMQELPCNHLFHPPCLKPWLDEHNSCPICRHELRTDDHEYESMKEREKEAEEDRKGAANAVRGGEYMYV